MGARKNGRPRGRHACLLLSQVFFLARIYFLARATQDRCLYRLQGVLRFIARSGNHIVTSLHVDKNGLFNFFQAEKRQQMRQAGQRLIFKWTAFFGGESGFRGQQHHSLGITTGLVRRNNLLLIATLLHYRDLGLRHSVYDRPGRSLRVLFICQN